MEDNARSIRTSSISVYNWAYFTGHIQRDKTMKKPKNAFLLAEDILGRSKCSVQVGAAIEDRHGIISWGWNFDGFDGHGMHAEAHAVRRANKERLRGATIYVASTRRRNCKVVTSKPCEDCQRLIDKLGLRVAWRDCNGEWVYEQRAI